MMRYLKILATGLFLSLPWIGAHAQQVNPYCLVSAGPPLQWAPCSSTNPLQISGSFSATTTGFPTTQSTGTPISVTTGGVTGTLPTGTVVVASNVGATNGAYCKLGASATTSDQLIPPNSWFAFTVGAATQLTCITSTSTTTVNMVGGSGLPTGSGGGGGGSSSNASVSATGSAVPASGTYVGLNSGGNLLGWPGTANGGLVDWNTSSQAHANSIAPIPVIAGTLPSTQTPVATGSTTKSQSDLNGNLYVNPISGYPAGAVPITASATGTTGATTATLAASASLKTYICSYSIRANATAATTVQNTITGVVTGTLTHQMWVAPLASGIGVDEQIFSPCVPSSAINTGIAVVSGAPGTGGLVSSTATGYQAP